MGLLQKTSMLSPADQLGAIMQNLERLLNTQKCHGSVLPDYGLGDYDGTLHTPEALDTLSNELRTCVERYEPRIRQPRLSLLGRGPKQRIYFKLDGRLAAEEICLTICFDIVYHRVTLTALV